MAKPSVVVIGGGLAGTLLCNEIIGFADVTLLEVGAKDTVSYPPIVVEGRTLAHVPTFCHGGGGTTNLWHNGLMPIDPRDVAGSEFRDVLADARTLTDAAASRLFFDGTFSRSYGEAVAQATAIAARAGILGDGVDCLIYPKRFRPLAVDPAVRGYYGVERCEFAWDGDRLTGIAFTAAGTRHTLKPSHVVIAAGTMGSPKVLRDVIAALGRPAVVLGRGFIDHPIGFVGKVRFKKETAEAVRRLSVIDKGTYEVRTAFRIRSSDGRFTCCAYLRPALTLRNDLDTYKYTSTLGATRGLTRLRHACSPRLLHPDVLAEICGHVLGVHPSRRTYNILLVAEQRRGGNRVHYAGDELHVDWSIAADELAAYRDVLRQFRERLLPVADAVNIELALTGDWLWSGAHHSGTTPLGAGSAALVDRDLKVRGSANVYVCDGSVIQEHSYANTGLTIGQLALRLARRLRDARD